MDQDRHNDGKLLQLPKTDKDWIGDVNIKGVFQLNFYLKKKYLLWFVLPLFLNSPSISHGENFFH